MNPLTSPQSSESQQASSGLSKKATLIIASALVIGLVVGYASAAVHIKKKFGMKRDGASHMMHDGRMMMNTDMSMSDMMSSMTMNLEGKTGDVFDKAFIEDMIVHHQGAVAMAELALKNSSRAEIKTLSQAIITAQNKEIADMKSWLASWFGAK